MSIPQLFLTASSPSASSIVIPNNVARKFQTPDVSVTSKKNIRERLNMHVKKRIQGHDIVTQQYSLPSPSPTSPSPSSLYTNPALSSAIKQNHPFLMSGE